MATPTSPNGTTRLMGPLQRVRRRRSTDARSSDTAATDRMIDHQDDDGARNRDEQAVQVEPGHAGHPEKIEEPAAGDRSNDAKDEVEHESFARLVDELAGDEAGQHSENDPGQ